MKTLTMLLALILGLATKHMPKEVPKPTPELIAQDISDRDTRELMHQMWSGSGMPNKINRDIVSMLDSVSDRVLADIVRCRYSEMSKETKDAARDEALARLLSN